MSLLYTKNKDDDLVHMIAAEVCSSKSFDIVNRSMLEPKTSPNRCVITFTSVTKIVFTTWISQRPGKRL